jgi:cation diffusion facilitator family transporter
LKKGIRFHLEGKLIEGKIGSDKSEYMKNHSKNKSLHSRLDHRADEPSCSHQHIDVEDTIGVRLLITLVLNFIIPVVQVIGGLLANSIALISDAVHNFSDFTAILISYVAFKIGRKGASVKNTFGYRRAEIMAALLNVVILTGASLFIIYGAVHRIRHPEAVSGIVVVLAAGIGILGNGFSAWLLHRDSKHSLNVRSAFLHMLGDFLFSVAVLFNGLVLIFKPWYWLDPLLSILIVLFILKNCWSILKESTAVLMNAAPKGFDLNEVKCYLELIPEIIGVHYLHAWNVSSSSIAFSCHVVVPDQSISNTEKMSEVMRHELLHRFGVDHPVLQFETTECGNGSLLCEISCKGNNSVDSLSSAEKGKRFRKKKINLLRILYHTARWILGVVFIYASFDKIIHPAAFSEAIYNYQILPDIFINLTAIILPWLELIMGIMLVIGVWMPGVVVMSNFLLTVFMGALIFNMARGLDFYCGCFSTSDTESTINIWIVLRDASLLILSIYLLFIVFFTKLSAVSKRTNYNPS